MIFATYQPIIFDIEISKAGKLIRKAEMLFKFVIWITFFITDSKKAQTPRNEKSPVFFCYFSNME